METMSGSTEMHASAAREGDPAEFAKLYDRVSPALHGWAHFRIHGPMRKHIDADDIVQEIWWRAIDAFSSFDAERSRFRAWVFGIANNVFREFMRRSPVGRVRMSTDRSDARIESLPPEMRAQITSISAGLRQDERVQHILDIAAELGREDRELLIHCGLEGLLLKEAAPIVGLSLEAAKKRWQRLRADLKDRPGWSSVVDSLE